jgi:hypothetical protein
MRPLPACLALLLAVAAVVAVAGATSPAASTYGMTAQNDSANYLSVPPSEVTREGTASADLSLGTALATETTDIQIQHDRLSLQRELAVAENRSAKTALIRRTADRIERQQARLRARDATTIASFANGSQSRTAFVRERARVSNEANSLQRFVSSIRSQARTDDSYSLSTTLSGRLASLAGELEGMQGPVSTTVAAAAGGDTQGRMVYAEASDSGYTLAYVTQDAYHRETYLGQERRPNGTSAFADSDQPPLNAAHNRGFDLYPWVTNNSVSPNSFGLGLSGIYRFSVDFTNGEVTAYLDGATTNAFREAQRQNLVGIPQTSTRRVETDSLALRVNRTFETGPMLVTVTRPGAARTVNASVSVDGERLGTTGVDGRVWVVEPRNASTVTVQTAANDSVRLPLSG